MKKKMKLLMNFQRKKSKIDKKEGEKVKTRNKTWNRVNRCYKIS